MNSRRLRNDAYMELEGDGYTIDRHYDFTYEVGSPGGDAVEDYGQGLWIGGSQDICGLLVAVHYDDIHAWARLDMAQVQGLHDYLSEFLTINDECEEVQA